MQIWLSMSSEYLDWKCIFFLLLAHLLTTYSRARFSSLNVRALPKGYVKHKSLGPLQSVWVSEPAAEPENLHFWQIFKVYWGCWSGDHTLSNIAQGHGNLSLSLLLCRMDVIITSLTTLQHCWEEQMKKWAWEIQALA